MDTSSQQQFDKIEEHLQPSLLTTEPTAQPVFGGIGQSADNIIGEENSLFDKALIDINTAYAKHRHNSL